MNQTIEPELRYEVDINGVASHLDPVGLPEIGGLLIERGGDFRVFDRVSGLLLFEGSPDHLDKMLNVVDPSRTSHGYEMDGVA